MHNLWEATYKFFLIVELLYFQIKVANVAIVSTQKLSFKWPPIDFACGLARYTELNRVGNAADWIAQQHFCSTPLLQQTVCNKITVRKTT